MKFKFLTKLSRLFSTETNQSPDSTIIPRSKHSISRNQISPEALKVLYRLNKAKYQAYLVGGGVRDLLMDHIPKDFDIVTNAHPEQVRRLFNNCRLIGRRFRLAHIFFGNEIVEVATFRATHHEHHSDESGRILQDNVYGTLEEDVFRRDFTINALYYNIADFSLLDLTGGLNDLQQKIIRIIGDPLTRIKEDPVRILRAIRFAAKFDFTLEENLESVLKKHQALLASVPPARLFEEYIKLFIKGRAIATFQMLRAYHVFSYLFKQTEHCLQENTAPTELFLTTALEDTDQRVNADKPVAIGYLLAVFLWHPVQQLADKICEEQECSYPVAFEQAAYQVLQQQGKQLSIPKKITSMVYEVWSLQLRFAKRRGKAAYRTLHYQRFRAGFDFLSLRARCGEPVTELAQWWQQFQEADHESQGAMVHDLGNTKHRNKRKNHPKNKADNG